VLGCARMTDKAKRREAVGGLSVPGGVRVFFFTVEY
jgi:hypothetical protein